MAMENPPVPIQVERKVSKQPIISRSKTVDFIVEESNNEDQKNTDQSIEAPQDDIIFEESDSTSKNFPQRHQNNIKISDVQIASLKYELMKVKLDLEKAKKKTIDVEVNWKNKMSRISQINLH